jgi:2-methylcitrate dehydratase PrpD
MAALASAVADLGEFVSRFEWADVGEDVADRLRLALLDTLGVTVAGASTPEHRALVDAWVLPPGSARLLGAGRATDIDAAAWLNGSAACCLELDEGNKYARGHPAAHVFPAALALGEVRHVPGPELCAALLTGYEVAARFGRALQPVGGLHPHGQWGALGAAAAAARLCRLGPDGVAAAIDAAAGLPVAGHFGSALRGSYVRNTWVGAANAHGLVAARLAAAGLAAVDETAALSLGSLLGTLDPATLTADLGSRFDVTHGYFKRHASCSYTHPPADAVLALRRDHPDLHPDDIAGVEVATHHLAAPLDATAFPTRLAAMFSIPYVVAVALAEGSCRPEAFDDRRRRDRTILRLASVTAVHVDEELDARLPDERGARVTVRRHGGGSLVASVPNPIGDADHEPFGPAEVMDKLEELIGDDAPLLASVVEQLPTADDVAGLLATLP